MPPSSSKAGSARRGTSGSGHHRCRERRRPRPAEDSSRRRARRSPVAQICVIRGATAPGIRQHAAWYLASHAMAQGAPTSLTTCCARWAITTGSRRFRRSRMTAPTTPKSCASRSRAGTLSWSSSSSRPANNAPRSIHPCDRSRRAPHHQPAGHLPGLRARDECDEGSLGDLGARDPLAGLLVEHRLGVLDRSPCVFGDGGRRGLHRGPSRTVIDKSAAARMAA
jgi:hypothetical protein